MGLDISGEKDDGGSVVSSSRGRSFCFFENRDGGKRWNEFVGFLAEMCVPPLHVVLLTRDNVNVDLGGKVVGGGKAAHVHDYVLLLWTVQGIGE